MATRGCSSPRSARSARHGPFAIVERRSADPPVFCACAGFAVRRGQAINAAGRRQLMLFIRADRPIRLSPLAWNIFSTERDRSLSALDSCVWSTVSVPSFSVLTPDRPASWGPDRRRCRAPAWWWSACASSGPANARRVGAQIARDRVDRLVQRGHIVVIGRGRTFGHDGAERRAGLEPVSASAAWSTPRTGSCSRRAPGR